MTAPRRPPRIDLSVIAAFANAPRCLNLGCGAPFTVHDPTRPGARPRTGAVAVCGYCATVHVMEVDPAGVVSVRAPTPAEVRRIEDDPRVDQLRAEVARSSRPSDAAATVRRSQRRAADARRDREGVIDNRGRRATFRGRVHRNGH
jgi:hypothetical protein